MEEWLMDEHRIEEIVSQVVRQCLETGSAAPEERDTRFPEYTDYLTGAVYGEKPEYMTHMYGKRLIRKDAPMIRYRGKLDHLQAEIVFAQSMIAALCPDSQGRRQLLEELTEILQACRELMRSELTQDSVRIHTLLGMDSTELRDHSHHSSKYYHVPTMERPDYKKGIAYALLNLIRTSVRETELQAVEAFFDEHNTRRDDILEILNRLSSAMHIMMCKCSAGMYS